MKIKASITISRDSNDIINVRIEDRASHIEFARMEFTPHDFMMALIGLSSVDAQSAEVIGLDAVGKRKVTETRSIVYPGKSYDDRDKMRAWLIENGKEEGWIVHPHLGSQRSISTVTGKTTLNYSVYRYEEISDTQGEKNV